MQDGAGEVTATISKPQRGYGRPSEERIALKKTLKYPEGYYVSENNDGHVFKNGSTHVLYRPDGTEVWSFDPAAALECEVILTAFDDHGEQLMERPKEHILSRGSPPDEKMALSSSIRNTAEDADLYGD